MNRRIDSSNRLFIIQVTVYVSQIADLFMAMPSTRDTH